MGLLGDYFFAGNVHGIQVGDSHLTQSWGTAMLQHVGTMPVDFTLAQVDSRVEWTLAHALISLVRNRFTNVTYQEIGSRYRTGLP